MAWSNQKEEKKPRNLRERVVLLDEAWKLDIKLMRLALSRRIEDEVPCEWLTGLIDRAIADRRDLKLLLRFTGE